LDETLRQPSLASPTVWRRPPAVESWTADSEGNERLANGFRESNDRGTCGRSIESRQSSAQAPPLASAVLADADGAIEIMELELGPNVTLRLPLIKGTFDKFRGEKPLKTPRGRT
jgi:hypothetical protein